MKTHKNSDNAQKHMVDLLSTAGGRNRPLIACLHLVFAHHHFYLALLITNFLTPTQGLCLPSKDLGNVNPAIDAICSGWCFPRILFLLLVLYLPICSSMLSVPALVPHPSFVVVSCTVHFVLSENCSVRRPWCPTGPLTPPRVLNSIRDVRRRK